MDFAPGSRVICTHPGPWEGGYGDELAPAFNEVCTIREIVTPGKGGVIGLRFVEIINEDRAYADGLREAWFMAHRFRAA